MQFSWDRKTGANVDLYQFSTSLKLNDENTLFDIEAGREGKTKYYLHLVSKFEIREYTFTPCLIPSIYTVGRELEALEDHDSFLVS